MFLTTGLQSSTAIPVKGYRRPDTGIERRRRGNHELSYKIVPPGFTWGRTCPDSGH